MTSPSISVVTVTLNSARDLPRLIDSLRAQSDRDFEHVVIDGGSTDGTWDIVGRSRDVVTYAVSEPDRGLYDALNKALRAVRTEYYLVMGADDVLYPAAIANFRAIAQQSNADVVVAGVKTGDRTRRGLHVRRAACACAAGRRASNLVLLARRAADDPVPGRRNRAIGQAGVWFGGAVRVLAAEDMGGVARASLAALTQGGDLFDLRTQGRRELAAGLAPGRAWSGGLTLPSGRVPGSGGG